MSGTYTYVYAADSMERLVKKKHNRQQAVKTSEGTRKHAEKFVFRRVAPHT